MLDYHSGSLCLDEFAAALAAEIFTDPAVAAARDKAAAAVGAEGGPALIGAFVHHLLTHASSDGAELDLLGRAADLWRRGSTLCSDLGEIRAALEFALENPTAPGAANRFNTAAVDAQNLAQKANELRVEVNDLRQAVLAYPHLPRHPRQEDRKADTWDWGNLCLARRTEALVRRLFRLASDKKTLAFAVGVASAYGANAAGSAYLGHVVGGPRRNHRHRDRIARNAFGSWLASKHPGAERPTKMADRIAPGAARSPTLPGELEALLRDAIATTFDTKRTVPLPDLQVGFGRLVQHLRLLDAFELPKPPSMPPKVFVDAVMSGPQGAPPSLRPQDADIDGMDGGGVAVSYGGPPSGGSTSPSSSDDDVKKGCGIAAVVLILLDVLQAFVRCCVQWAKDETCTFWDNMFTKKLFEQDPPDPTDPTRPENPDVTAQGLAAIAGQAQAAQMVWLLFDTHNMVWEAMSKAYEFLALTGLIYPGGLISRPLYAQFTSLPGLQPWPRREDPEAEDTYHFYPTTPIENPNAQASPFPKGVLPDEFLRRDSRYCATDVTLRLWRQIAAGQQDSQNFDLDADRGARHPCWAAGNSVHQDPIDVVLLPYTEQ